MGQKSKWEYLKAFIKGYFDYPNHCEEGDIHSFCYSAMILTFEQAIRFAEDYMRGDIYFKVQNHDQNLFRTRNQIAFYNILKSELDSINELILKVSKS